MRARAAGASLATTLMVAAVVITLAFSLISLCLSHLQVTTRWSNAYQARNLAESLLALAAARVVDEPGFQDTLRLTPAAGGEAVLTFDTETAQAESIPCSTNNLERESSAPGWGGQIVPGSAAHLVARAVYRGVERRMEAIVAVPAYPYVLASAGPFRSEGGLTVGSLTDPEDLQASLDPDDLHKGRLASNSRSDEAFQLGPGTRIVGDVSAVGGVRLHPDGKVDGRVTSHGEAVAIPRIPLEDFDPQRSGKPGLQTLNDVTTSSLSLEGYCRRQGSLHVNGPLVLKGAVLYVSGDLTVEGGIQGKGCLVVEGRTTLGGGSALASDNVAALISRGDVTLEGGGSFFQGLVYTEGNLTARDVTLLGTLIANSPEGSTEEPVVTLSNSTVVNAPRTAKVVVPLQDDRPNMFFWPNDGWWEEHDDDDHHHADRWDNNWRYSWARPVSMVARANGDGTYFVHDPKLASVAEKLTLTEAVNHIEALLESHYHWRVHAEQRDRIWRKLQRLTPAAPAQAAAEAPQQVLTVDPNRFLGLKDKARIVLWRPL